MKKGAWVKLLLFLIIASVFVAAFLYRKTQISNSTNIYLPISIGNFWEYEGIKEEQQVGGIIEKSEIKKRIEIIDIINNDKGEIIKLADGLTYITTDHTIDFEPESTEADRFTLTFPLSIGQKWGDEVYLKSRTDGYYTWEVETKLFLDILGKRYDECYRIALKMLTGTDYKIYCYGLGIVEEGYTHNGTVFNKIYKLTRFKIN